MTPPLDALFWTMAAALVAGAMALVAALATLADRSGRRIRRRAAALARPAPTGLPGETRVSRGGTECGGLLARLAAAIPNRAALEARLVRTGRPITLDRYLAISAIVALVAMVVLALLRFRLPLLLAGGIAAGIFLPRAWIGSLIARRSATFLALFADAVDLIVRGLKTGLPTIETIATVGRDMPDPVGIEFRRIADEIRLGRPVEEAMTDTARRLAIPEFDFFVVSLSVQRQTGGNLAETLEKLSEMLRRRQQMRLKVRAMSSEARASAWIIGGLPFLICGLLFVINPGYVGKLFTESRGLMLLTVGLAGEAMGVFVMMRMARFEI